MSKKKDDFFQGCHLKIFAIFCKDVYRINQIQKFRYPKSVDWLLTNDNYSRFKTQTCYLIFFRLFKTFYLDTK